MAVDPRRRASKSRYIPALAFTRLTSWYDPIVRWTTREDVFRARLVAQSAVRSGDRVLDVGCGTGTLTIKISRAQPGATITGLDGDPAVLSQAKRKASECGTPITWIEGRADALPFADSSFERVVSSLLFTISTAQRNWKRCAKSDAFWPLAGSCISLIGAAPQIRSCESPFSQFSCWTVLPQPPTMSAVSCRNLCPNRGWPT